MAIPESIINNPDALAAYQRAIQQADELTASVQADQLEPPSADNRELFGRGTYDIDPLTVIGNSMQNLSPHRANIAPAHHLPDETRKTGLLHIEAIRQQQGW